MPWTAIPLNDIKSREYLEATFPVSDFIKSKPVSVVIDPTGMVLKLNAIQTFHSFGARGFPSTEERIKWLILENIKALYSLSVSKLLASAERNYDLDKNKQKVPLDNIDDKVVVLYFYDEEQDDDFLINIQKAYEQLVKEHNFEIVLVYVHDTFLAYELSSEELFWERLSKMPWLALPYKDPICKKLQQIFRHLLIIVEHIWTIPNSAKFWRRLKSRYLQMKGTENEFKVIHICGKEMSSYSSPVAPMSGLMLPIHRGSREDQLILRAFRQGFGLLAVDGEGRLVRRTVSTSIERDNFDFPFYAGSLEKDFSKELKDRFHWWYYKY